MLMLVSLFFVYQIDFNLMECPHFTHFLLLSSIPASDVVYCRVVCVIPSLNQCSGDEAQIFFIDGHSYLTEPFPWVDHNDGVQEKLDSKIWTEKQRKSGKYSVNSLSKA